MMKYKYFQFHFLSIVFCFWFSMFIYIPIFGIYLDLKNIGYVAAGMIMGSYGIMQIIIRLPMGVIADKYKISGKKLVSIGFIASIISALLLVLSNTFLPIFFGRLFAGLTAAMWVVLTIWYSTSFDKSRSLNAMGQLQATTVGSQLIGMAISGWIASLFGYTSLFWIGGFFAVIGLVLVLTLEDRSQTEGHHAKQVRTREGESIVRFALKNKQLWSLSVLSLLAHAVLFSTIFGFSPVYLTQLNGNSSAMMTLVIAFMLPHALAPTFLSMKREAISNPFVLLVICFGIGTLSLLSMWNVKDWAVYCVLHAILGLSLGFVFPVLLDQVFKVDAMNGSKTIMGFFQSVYSIGIVAGPMIAGYIARLIHLESVFIMSAVLLFLGGVVSTGEALIMSRREQVAVREVEG